MEKENITPDTVESPVPAQTPADYAEVKSADEAGTSTDLGKFKSVEALMHAYKVLEAEFTRRSQRLKALETAPPDGKAEEENRVPRDEELYREVSQNEGVRARVLDDYLKSLRGVPLMTGGGAGALAPKQKPKSIKDAGSLALGYLRNQKI